MFLLCLCELFPGFLPSSKNTPVGGLTKIKIALGVTECVYVSVHSVL